jgi:hypothetical protein
MRPISTRRSISMARSSTSSARPRRDLAAARTSPRSPAPGYWRRKEPRGGRRRKCTAAEFRTGLFCESPAWPHGQLLRRHPVPGHRPLGEPHWTWRELRGLPQSTTGSAGQPPSPHRRQARTPQVCRYHRTPPSRMESAARSHGFGGRRSDNAILECALALQGTPEN